MSNAENAVGGGQGRPPSGRMKILDFRIDITNGHSVPVLMYEPDAAAGTVLLYHGLGANKEVQRKELEWLSGAGLRALCIDAPHHGARSDGLLEALAVAENPHPQFIKLIREAVLEVPALVDFCLDKFGGKVAISGISLGGFISFAAVPLEKRLEACIPILGSPDWNHRDGRKADELLIELLQHAPLRHPREFPPCALLVANAGRDILVPPDASRAFVESLRPYYRNYPERLEYLEYPESEHMMREEDWVDLWQKITAWLLRLFQNCGGRASVPAVCCDSPQFIGGQSRPPSET